MNKKGFTLVELLAVIAILAILVIIALPNVIKLYNNAKKNSFLTEAKTIYKEAANKYITESMKGNKVSYINSNNKYTSSLDLNSDKDLQYCINLDNSGNVINMSVLNNEYYLEYSSDKDITKYNKENVKDKNDKTKMLCSKNNNKIIQMPDKKECESDSDDTYSDGTYTYTKSGKGWGVKLTDLESTDPVTETPCSIINGKPILTVKDMFMNSKASSIDLSDFDTSNVTDMSHMFWNTTATEIKGLEYLDTSNVENMGQMFRESNVTDVDLSGFYAPKLWSMYYMFYLSKIKNIDLSNLNTDKLTDIRGAFRNSGADVIDITGLNISNIKDMSLLFAATSKVKEIIGLNTLDTSNVTDMHSMFYGCNASSLDLSKFNTSNVTTMNAMFATAKSQILNLSNFDTRKVTDMGGMFWRTESQTINLSGFDTSNVTIMNAMFYQSDVTNVIGLDSFDTSNVTDMGEMFRACKFEYLDLSSFNMDIVTNYDNMFMSITSKKIYAKSEKEKEIFESSVTKKPSSVIVEIKK